MQKQSGIYALALVTAGMWLLPVAMPRTLVLSGKQTLRNLQTAWSGESNARTRYLAFAVQADKEGYGQVAVLFRAAARAEEIHLGNHAAVIKQLGAIPQTRIEQPLVRSTKENLEKSAGTNEAWERDTMYPAFIRTAVRENVPEAVESFEYALEAETGHYNLFANALEHLSDMRNADVTYYVCTVSGYTSTAKDPAKCMRGVFEPIR